MPSEGLKADLGALARQRRVKIYVLKDPRTNIVRYVGKTSQTLRRRLTGHLSDRGVNYRTAWLNSLQSQGLIPIIELIDEVDEVEWAVAEQKWISFYRSTSDCLVNLTDGGDHNPTSTDEVRGKLSRIMLNLLEDPLYREQWLARMQSLEMREKRSRALRGRKAPWAKNNSKPAGWQQTSRAKAKIAAASIGRKPSPEVRMRISQSMKGNQNSLGNKSKLGQSKIKSEISGGIVL